MRLFTVTASVSLTNTPQAPWSERHLGKQSKSTNQRLDTDNGFVGEFSCVDLQEPEMNPVGQADETRRPWVVALLGVAGC